MSHKQELKHIEQLYLDGKLTTDTDEKYAGGYWDLAGKIANELATDDWQYENLQDFFYRGLISIFVHGIGVDEYMESNQSCPKCKNNY